MNISHLFKSREREESAPRTSDDRILIQAAMLNRAARVIEVIESDDFEEPFELTIGQQVSMNYYSRYGRWWTPDGEEIRRGTWPSYR